MERCNQKELTNGYSGFLGEINLLLLYTVYTMFGSNVSPCGRHMDGVTRNPFRKNHHAYELGTGPIIKL